MPPFRVLSFPTCGFCTPTSLVGALSREGRQPSPMPVNHSVKLKGRSPPSRFVSANVVDFPSSCAPRALRVKEALRLSAIKSTNHLHYPAASSNRHPGALRRPQEKTFLFTFTLRHASVISLVLASRNMAHIRILPSLLSDEVTRASTLSPLFSSPMYFLGAHVPYFHQLNQKQGGGYTPLRLSHSAGERRRAGSGGLLLAAGLSLQNQ